MQNRMDLLDVTSLGDTHRVTARHQCSTRRPANRLSVETGELHPLLRHRIEMRGANIGRSKTADILISLVVGEDHHKVGWTVGGGCRIYVAPVWRGELRIQL